MNIRYNVGDKDTRPWGTWEVVDVGEKHIVKKLTLLPGQSVSLQLHHHRNEHWVIVHGIATVTLGDKLLSIPENENVYIPVETKHRIANDTNETLVFIEIQTGAVLDENDIVRFEDKYGRIPA